MSTVLDALKKIQSDRDRGGISEPGALHREVVGAASPTPTKRRWVIWVASLGVVVMVGGAAGFFFLSNGGETTALALEPSPSGENNGGPKAVRRNQTRSGDETRPGRARAASRPSPTRAPARERRAEGERQKIADAMQKNLATGAPARNAREAGKASGTRAEARLPAAVKQQDSLSSDAGSDVGDPGRLPETDLAPETPVMQGAQSSAVSAPEQPDGSEEGKEWEAGSGSVRMVTRTPEGRAPVPGATPIPTPAPQPEPAPREEPKPAPRAAPKPAQRVEPEPAELLGVPLATALLFPEVSLEAVRWHPDAKRREARLTIDNARPVDVREGDIVAGVAVQRIEPGAVELAMGASRMWVRIGQ